MTATLRDYLSGKTDLVEFTSPMGGSSMGGVGPSVRSEKLEQLWEEMMVKLWALWQDILDQNEDMYEEAKPHLDEMKGIGPDQCRAAEPVMRLLHRIVTKHTFVDKYTPEPQLKLFAARQKELNAELEYMCDQFDPDVPRPPETPVKSRKDWDKGQVEKRKSDREADKAAEGKGAADMTFYQDREKNPTASFMPDRQDIGKDQAGPNSKESRPKSKPKTASKPSAPTRKTPKGGDAKPGAKATKAPGQKNGQKDSQSHKQPKAGKGDKGKKAADKKADITKKEPDKKAAKKKIKESRSTDACPSVVMASLAEAADRPYGSEVEAAFLSAGDAIRVCLEKYTDGDCVHTEIGEAIPGGSPRLDLFVEWTNGSRPTDCYGYSRLWYEGEELTVMDSSDRVVDRIEVSEKISDTELAGRLYASLEEVYDASNRRIWESNKVVPALYRLLERAQRGESVPQSAYATVLLGLRSGLGLHEKVRVPGTSIRMIEERGGYHFSWAVKTPLTHNTDLPDELDPQDYSMKDPSPGDERAQGELHGKKPYLQNSPINTKNYDGDPLNSKNRKWRFARWQSCVEACSGFLRDMRAKLQEDPSNILCKMTVTALERRLQRLQDEKPVSLSEEWRTPTIRLDPANGKLFIGEEEVSKDAKDEDVTAKIATAGFQKESASGTFGEPTFEPNAIGFTMWESHATQAELKKKLNKLPMRQIMAIAVALGVKTPGDGNPFTKEKAIRHILLRKAGEHEDDYLPKLGESWVEGFERSLDNQDQDAVTGAAVHAIAEEGLEGREARQWIDQHWREFL